MARKQRLIQDQIDAGIAEQEKLKDKVAAIEGSTAAHRYVYDNDTINPREGKFVGISEDYSSPEPSTSALKYLAFGGKDAAGDEIDWEKVKKDDVIRVVSTSGDRVEYKVEECNNGLFVVNQAEDPVYLGFEAFVAGEEYSTTVLSAFDPTGLATIEYVDQRVDTKLEKTGDIMSGVLNMDDNYIANVHDPDSDTDAVNRRYLKSKWKAS